MDPAEFDLDALSQAAAGYSGAEIEEAIISAMFDAFYDIDKLYKDLKKYYKWLKEQFGNERAEQFIKKMEEI